MEKKIINKVPHHINVLSNDGKIIKVFRKSSDMIRVTQCTTRIDEIDGIPISKTSFHGSINLPEYVEGVYYIVSSTVKFAYPERLDLLVPAEMIKDEQGNSIGCKSLSL